MSRVYARHESGIYPSYTRNIPILGYIPTEQQIYPLKNRVYLPIHVANIPSLYPEYTRFIPCPEKDRVFSGYIPKIYPPPGLMKRVYTLSHACVLNGISFAYIYETGIYPIPILESCIASGNKTVLNGYIPHTYPIIGIKRIPNTWLNEYTGYIPGLTGKRAYTRNIPIRQNGGYEAGNSWQGLNEYIRTYGY